MNGVIYTVNSVDTLKATQDSLAHSFMRQKYLEVTIETGKRRTIEQNKLIYRLYREAAFKHPGNSAEDIRRECKLTIGIPMLRTEDEKFKEKYDSQLRRQFTHEQKLLLMGWFPVTSLMDTDQLSRFAEAIANKYGVPLPDDR